MEQAKQCLTTATAQDVLPRPEPPFKGYIGRKAKESTADFPKEVAAPQSRLWIGWRNKASASTTSTPPPSARRRARRCSPAAQPPLQRDRRHHGDGHRFSRLQYADAEELRHDRRGAQAERLQRSHVGNCQRRTREEGILHRFGRPFRAYRRPGIRLLSQAQLPPLKSNRGRPLSRISSDWPYIPGVAARKCSV